MIKLMGPGEYVAEVPGDTEALGHFGLAVEHYSHSTAPNRRYPDVITQRLLKAALADRPAPYANDELADLAKHCTEQEDAAKKVERQIAKSAAALLLQSRIGQRFDAIVTGASDKGTWVRVFNPPVEGKLVQGARARRGPQASGRVAWRGRGTRLYRFQEGGVIMLIDTAVDETARREAHRKAREFIENEQQFHLARCRPSNPIPKPAAWRRLPSATLRPLSECCRRSTRTSCPKRNKYSPDRNLRGWWPPCNGQSTAMGGSAFPAVAQQAA